MIENRHSQTTGSCSRNVRLGLRALWALAVGALGLFIAHVGFGLLADQSGVFKALYASLFLLPATLCILHGALHARERTAWILFGIGIASSAVGWAHYFLVLRGHQGSFYPSLSDAFWLAFAPLSLIALMLLLRSRIPAGRRISWIDALIATLTLAAIAAALLFEPASESTGSSTAKVITGLAYPLADILVLGLILRVLALSGWRPGKTWLIIAAAWTIQIVADTMYLHQATSGTYRFGTLLDACWPAVALLIAYAARQVPERAESVKPEGWAAVTAPTLFALAALTITTYDSFRGINEVAVALATAVLVLAVVRAATLFAEVRSLSRSSELLARHESILESAGEGIWGIDCDGRTIFANRAATQLTGYSVEELIGRHTHSLVHHTRPDGTPYPTEECPIEDSLRYGRVHQVSGELYFRKDGSSFPVEYTSTPIRENGQVTGAVVVFKDVTERRRAEEEQSTLERRLQQTQRMHSVGQLAGGIAHDFNNLLAVILNYASFVREDLPEGAPIRHDVDEIHAAAERAAALTHQLLLFSRRDTTQPERLDLNSVVADMEKLFRRTLGEHVELVTAPGADLRQVEADRGQLEQVLMNLVVNARDAMAQGGTLVIATANVDLTDEARDEAGIGSARIVELSVADSGCGMEPEVVAQAVEPFYTTKPKGEGTGLGLATVWGIVSQAGGTLSIDSIPGTGTKVTVRLPAAVGAAPTPSRPQKSIRAARNGGGTILLAEDEEPVRELTRRILSEHGYRVLEAYDGHHAVKVWERNHGAVDLLLTDVIMPGLSGGELATLVRQLNPHLPVVFFSGYTDDLIPRNCVDDAGSPYLVKPFTSESLLHAVSEALIQPTA